MTGSHGRCRSVPRQERRRAAPFQCDPRPDGPREGPEDGGGAVIHSVRNKADAGQPRGMPPGVLGALRRGMQNALPKYDTVQCHQGDGSLDPGERLMGVPPFGGVTLNSHLLSAIGTHCRLARSAPYGTA